MAVVAQDCPFEGLQASTIARHFQRVAAGIPNAAELGHHDAPAPCNAGKGVGARTGWRCMRLVSVRDVSRITSIVLASASSMRAQKAGEVDRHTGGQP